MPEQTRFLVPLRYPLTAQSTCTLSHAEQLAQERDDEQVYLFILHVNLFQYNENVRESEIHLAIDPLLSDIPFSVITRSGFLVEELILDEANNLDIDTIVIGQKQSPWWRRVLTQVFRKEPVVASFLRNRTGPNIDVEVVESPI